MKFLKAFILLFSILLLWACDLVEPPVAIETPVATTPTLPSLSEIVVAGKIPAKSQLSTYDKAVQDIFRPLAAETEKDLGIVYVTVSGGSTTQDGTSWDTAYANPKTGIDEAGSKANDQNPYLVLLAGGTYAVTTTLSMKNDVAIVGGITSTFLASTTILDGDGTKQVFRNTSLDNTAILYGVTITKGLAQYGGGMNNVLSSPSLNQVTFSANTATTSGGAMYNDTSSPTLSQIIFSANTATTRGGGMYNSKSSPTLSQVLFSANTSSSGAGGMYNILSSPVLSQVTFSANTATNDGGGMYNYKSSPTLIQVTLFGNTANLRGGGMLNDNDGKDGPKIINSIFWGNTQGTANKKASQIYIYNNLNFDEEKMQIYYSIVQGTSDSEKFLNSGGTAAISITKHGMIDTDPNLSALADNGGYVQTLALASGSSAIDAGIYVQKSGTSYYYSSDASTWYTTLNASGFSTGASLPTGATNLTATDARGYAIEGRPDLGAYEFGTKTSYTPPKESTDLTLKGIVKAGKIPARSQLSKYDKATQDILRPLVTETAKPLGIIYVTVSGGSTTKDGTSWDTAYANPKTGIDEAGSKANGQNPYLVLVAGGTYALTTTLSMRNNVAIVGGITINLEHGDETKLDGGATKQVFSNTGLDRTAILYGVTITNGKAEYGGGMYNTASSPYLRHVTFSANTATTNGGGMFNVNSAPTLSRVTFFANRAYSGQQNKGGGGMFNSNSLPTLSRVTFSNNRAHLGGGMFNSNSSPTLSQVTISANKADSFGGGMFNDNDGATGPTIINSIFSGNTQGDNNRASQIYMYNYGNSRENMQIYYSIVQEASDDNKRFIQNYDSSEKFIIAYPSGHGTVAITQYGVLDTKNPKNDPKLVDLRLAALADNGGYVQTMALASGSPAIDAGIYVQRSGTSYYYSKDASTWYTTLNASGFSTSATLPTGAINLTATDARGSAIMGHPDLGAYEFGTRILPAVEPKDPPPTTTPVATPVTTPKTLKGIVAAGKIPAKSQLSTYDKAAQDIFGPLATKIEKDLGIVYVTVSGGSTSKNGSSWETAYDEGRLRSAINEAGSSARDQKSYLVLVAGGSYTVGSTLSMQNNVAIVGGITSTFLASKTTLDGDNVRPVFNNSRLNKTAVLYGVTITKGNSSNGGGMSNTDSSPYLSQVTFSANKASDSGGGMYNTGSSPTLNQVTFSANTAVAGLGGRANGGGMYNTGFSSPALNQITFSANKATTNGGGMFNSSSSPSLNQVTFSANKANYGGGMFNDNDGATGPTIINSIFWGNRKIIRPPGKKGPSEDKGASQIYIYNDVDRNGLDKEEKIQIYYSIVQGANDAERFLNAGGTATVTISQNSVVGTDPNLSALASNGGYVQTLALGSGSPAIDKGIYVQRKGASYYYSSNASTWYMTLNAKGFSTSSSLPAGVINLTATDARGYTITGRPDLGAYESGGTAP